MNDAATSKAIEILTGWGERIDTFGGREAVRHAIRMTELVSDAELDAVTDAMIPMVKFHASVSVGRFAA